MGTAVASDATWEPTTADASGDNRGHFQSPPPAQETLLSPLHLTGCVSEQVMGTGRDVALIPFTAAPAGPTSRLAKP